MWDFKLRRDLNRLACLSYALRRYIVQKSFKMEDENRWKGLEIHLAHVGAVKRVLLGRYVPNRNARRVGTVFTTGGKGKIWLIRSGH